MMNRLRFLLLGAITCSFLSLNAQTEKGNFILGLSSNFGGSELGGISFGRNNFQSNNPNYVKSDDNEDFAFNLKPKLGYFIADHFAVGLDLLYGYEQSVNGSSSDKLSQQALVGGPFLRYYLPLNNQLLFFEASGAYGQSKIALDYKDNSFFEDDERLENVFYGSLSAGLAFKISTMTFLDLSIGYQYLQQWDPELETYDEYHYSNEFNLNIGLSVLLK